jgi:hypothetical protein
VSESVNELLRRVERALEEHAHAEDTTRTVESLTNLEEQLSPHIKNLGQAVDAFDTLDEVSMPAERPDTQFLATACRVAAEVVRRNKSGPQDLPRTLRDINDVVNTAKATAQPVWREFIDGLIPGLDSLNLFTEMLSKMVTDKVQVANLRRGVTDLRALSRRLPDASAPIQATAAVDIIYPAMTVLLGDTDADSDVRHFLETVARGGAHVRALTQAVKVWMRRRGVEGSFKIVAGQPANE